MKKTYLSFAIASIFWLVGTAPLLGAQNESLNRIVNQIDGMFPPLEGVVVSIDRQILTLDLKQGQPIKPGDRLKLIRFGKDIIHPISKKKIGRKETDLSEVEIIEVRQNFSLAKLTDPTALVRTGDGVRSPFNKLSFLVATPRIKTKKKIDKNRLRIELEDTLAMNPRFKVPAFELDLWLLENNLSIQSLLAPEHLDKLGRQVKADYLMVFSVGSIKKKLVLNYKLYSAQTGQLKKEAKILSDQLNQHAKRASPREQNVQRNFSRPEEGLVEYAGKQEFKFKIVDLDVGDINGDGQEELVVITPSRVIIYEYRENKLKQVASFRPKHKNHNFLGVDVGDINGNGMDEIFVTDHAGDSLSSFVLEASHKKKRLKKVWDDVNLYFRIIHPLGKKPVLLTQAPGFNDPFHGPIQKMIYKKGRYLSGKKLNLPSVHGTQFILYGLTLNDINGDNKYDIVMLDKNSHLRAYTTKGRVLVQSDDSYGHDPRLIEVGVKESIEGIVQEGTPVQYKGRLSFIRHGNSRYLIIPKVQSAAGRLLPGVIVDPNSSMVFLNLSQEGLRKSFEIKKQKGYNGGYGIMKETKISPKIMHMATIEGKSGLNKSNLSTIYTYFWKK